jgi:glucose-6-phosphate 1-epimerase
MNSQKFNVPGVSFSHLDSGLEIVSINNKYASAKITTNGAHIFEYIPAGEKNLLWVSKKAFFTPGKPIRGGVPVCWPWFGASLIEGRPGHGFVRVEEWQISDITELPSGATKLVFTLDSDMKQFAMADFPFTVNMIFTVGKELEMTLVMVNKGKEPVKIGCALHTYFAISDINKVVVSGLDNCSYFDHKVGAPQFAGNVQKGDIKVTSEIDNVYFPASGTTEIVDPGWGRIITVEKSGSDATVVWNPWADKATTMADYAPEEYTEMICVECANAKCDPRILLPGVPHQITQKIGLK